MEYDSFYRIRSIYPQISDKDGWGMDVRHIMILYNILLACHFKRVLEIGTHNGFSTTAFIEAIKHKPDIEVHLNDICFGEHIKSMCFHTNNIFLHEMKSIEYLKNAPKFDFVLLDGSHIAEDVQDEFEYLSMNNTDTYLLHDVNTQLLPESVCTPWYDGPLLLKERFMSSKDWMWIEDSQKRFNERTERGIFLATRDINVYNHACQIFNYWSLLKELQPEIL